MVASGDLYEAADVHQLKLDKLHQQFECHGN